MDPQISEVRKAWKIMPAVCLDLIKMLHAAAEAEPKEW